ncbi:hypothetical protein [Bacillus sp. 1NLA3E]|uniref:hypothetical protein n=1 Tax=Bacillus sp. 1NLA3E TaxID=666686 RepID=UPI000247F0E0|nr:hypothetical protein [Bacillus sp. 1NLA3E]
MGFYRTVCHKVEDFFVKMLSKKQDVEGLKIKVNHYRSEKEKLLQQRKMEKGKRLAD